MTTRGTDPKQRFSSRVDDYVRYRPCYPDAILDLFRNELGLTTASVLADVGSGTGISAEPFLRNGNLVYCVEPNANMRAAAERLLGPFPGFRSVSGSAEATTLPDRSVDFLLCAQAFHWFDRPKARAEFARVARPGAWVVLMWNNRRKAGTPFLEGYEALLQQFNTDYRQVDHTNLTDADIIAFLGGSPRTFRVPNAQHLDLAGLKGRAFSGSYTPPPGRPGHDELDEGLRALFDRTRDAGGRVTIEYDTEIFAGRVA